MNILLLNPPWLKNNREGVRAGSRWPYTMEKLTEEATIPFPFFLAYACALLTQKGYDAELLDGVALRMSIEQFFNELKNYTPEVIIMETSTSSYTFDIEIAKKIKSLFPTSKFVFGGYHASVFPHEILSEQNFVDYVLIGEYEYTLLELVKYLTNKENESNIPGIALRIDGNVKINPRQPLINDLDILPYPARNLKSIYRYNDIFCKYRPNVQIITSRGCVYKCPFCICPRVMYNGFNWRARNPINVVNEIEFLLENYDFKEFYFDDDTTNLKLSHIENITKEIKNRKLNIAWSFMGHTGNITKEFLELAKSSGCEGIKFGVETGSPEILKTLHKGITLEKAKMVFKWCKEIGIRTHATFTVGLPGETKKTIQDTINFMLEIDSDSLQISFVTPFPGTELYQLAKEKGWLIDNDWSGYDGAIAPTMRTEKLSHTELINLYQKIQIVWHRHELKRLLIKIIENKWEYLRKILCHPFLALNKLCEIIVKK